MRNSYHAFVSKAIAKTILFILHLALVYASKDYYMLYITNQGETKWIKLQ